MGSALRRVPAWAWLTAIVAGSVLARAILVRGIVAPFIFVDELIWSELARGIADAGKPLLRDQPDPGYSVVYPLLISPAYALFDGLPNAYAAVKAENTLLMSLAAVPAFFLARRVARDGLALLAAVLTVAVPSLAYTGTVMTENAFYPLFLLVVLVLVVVLERPTALWVILLLALAGAAYATRVQAVALGPAILLAPLLLAIFEPRGLRSTISRFRWLYGLVVGLAVAVLVGGLVLGHTPQDLLGAYSPVGDRSYDVSDALRYLWWHVAELALYVLVIPLAATIVLVGRARTLDSRLQAFLAATVALTVCIVPMVAVFASEFSARIEERNMFYVAPLLCIALLAWVDIGAPRPRLLATIAAVGSGLLVVAIPFDRFLTTSAITDTLMLLPLWSLQDRIGESWVPIVALGFAAVLAAAFLFVPGRYALVLAAARTRSLDRRGEADLVREARIRAILARCLVPGDSYRGSGLDRSEAPERRPRRLSLDGPHRPVHRATRTSSSIGRSGRSTTSRIRRPEAFPRPASGSTRRPVGSRSPTGAPCGIGTCWRTRRSLQTALRSQLTRDGASRCGACGHRSCPRRSSRGSIRTTPGPARRSRTRDGGARRDASPSRCPATRTSSSSPSGSSRARMVESSGAYG